MNKIHGAGEFKEAKKNDSNLDDAENGEDNNGIAFVDGGNENEDGIMGPEAGEENKPKFDVLDGFEEQFLKNDPENNPEDDFGDFEKDFLMEKGNQQELDEDDDF